MAVADLSASGGGPTPWHRSHQSGRDVDIVFFATDERGRVVPPLRGDMVAYDKWGKPKLKPREPYESEKWVKRRFDVRRNWMLVETLLRDPGIRLQWMFVSRGLRKKLLDHAKHSKVEPWLQEYAAVILRQPGDSAPHHDHFHVRIYCPRADRFHGCRDVGPVWHHEKKRHKYPGPERYDPFAVRAWSAALVAIRP